MQSVNNFFPAFISLENKKILIVGGGKIAYDKLEKLLFFTTDIKIISKEFDENLLKLAKENGINCQKKEYSLDILDGIDIVIVCVDDLEIHKKVFEDSRDKRILVNSVDKKEFCDFIFPSFIKRGDLTIAISTNGSSPAISRYLKKYIENKLPSGIDEFFQEMKRLRNTLPKGKNRMQILSKKAKDFFKIS